MKKKIVLFMILLSLCLDLFAYNAYLAPMQATNGIPMDPQQVWKEDKSEPVSGHYTPIPVGDGAWLKQEDAPVDGYIGAGKYTDNEMTALGGIKGMTRSEYYNSKIIVNASCSNGFYFVSQSNPNYKRPFELYLIPKVISSYNEEGGINHRLGDSYGTVRAFGDRNNSYEFSYAEMLGNQEINFPADGDNFASEKYDMPRLWFDMVLVLPGYVENNVLKWSGHGEYPLVKADDYSALVTLTLQPVVNGVEGTVQTLTIPFSGFYDPNDQYRHKGATVSMYVHPTASSGNINLRDYSRQQIAEIEVLSVMDEDTNKGIGSREFGFGVFASSNPDPFTKGKPFKLVKENLKYDDKVNEYNSVPFNVILVDAKDLNNMKSYNGEASITKNDIYGGAKQEYWGGFIPTGKWNYDHIPTILLKPTAKKITPNSHSTAIDTWYLSSKAYIEILGNPKITMEAGRYTSTVYIHVIGFN